MSLDLRHPLNIGAGILCPGVTQIQWQERDRGLMFLISFLAALLTALFCWGDLLGWVMLGFAFLCHAGAMLDVLRQRSFPVFPSRIAACAVVVVMVLIVYLPLSLLLWLYAQPTRGDKVAGDGYLVNCLAYQGQEPQPGQWIWMRMTSGGRQCAGLILAIAGQEVEWTGRRWLVDGKDLASTHPGALSHYPEGWRFRVPEHHFLVGSEDSAREMAPASPLVLVGREQIVGRAWAKYYPVWERCLL